MVSSFSYVLSDNKIMINIFLNENTLLNDPSNEKDSQYFDEKRMNQNIHKDEKRMT